MANGWDIVLVAAALIGYAMFSRRLAGSAITSAMVFVTFGYIVGTEVLDLFATEIGSAHLRLLAEITLALVLFSDASTLDTQRLARETRVPLRLLGIALPLAIVLGTAIAALMFSELGVFGALALAVVLAPTDAALGQTVVADHRLPSALRQGLNVESGLNDGVCVPLLVAALAFAELEEAPGFDGEVLVSLVEEILIATVVGLAVAGVLALVVTISHQRDWLAPHWARIIPLAGTLATYAAAVELGGSGFIASFIAGLVVAAIEPDSIELTEELGQALSAVTFLAFGAVLIGPTLSRLDLATVLYAACSLTFIRMLPVALSMIGTHARLPTQLFAGWFGPRGLATIVFTLTIVEESGIEGTGRIVDVANLTVLLSVFAHGLTAPAFTTRYAGWLSQHDEPLTHDKVRHHSA